MLLPSGDETSMTVGELIEELSKLERSKPVQMEGCDCMGSLKSVTDYGHYVTLERPS